VSTGALIAPFAFVGTPAAYEEAFLAYREPKPHWFRVRNLLAILLFRESFIDNGGLRSEIASRIDEPMLRTIAQAGAEHRLLLIGTTNLDLGLLTMWDATRLAREITDGGKPRSAFDDVILASTAIPAVFPPVLIDGDHYVDGGVTRNIAYTTDQDSPHSTINIWKAEFPDRPFPRTRVWVVINNQLTTRSESMSPRWPSVMERSLDISVRSATLNSLKALAVSIELMRLRDQVDIELRFIAIPDDWRPPVKGVFQKETMSILAELGCRLGADPASWRTTVPNPEFPEN
jgi:predicted acylesterase/phospholipase RssA